MKKESSIVPTFLTPDGWEPQYSCEHPGHGPAPEKLRTAGIERILGRKVLYGLPCVGSYGMGGPGFIGFALAKSLDHPDEMLVLCIWGATDWVQVDGKQWEDLGDTYHKRSEYYQNVKGTIMIAEINDKSCSFKIGKHEVVLSERAEDRPVFAGTGGRRELFPDDSLWDAWAISKPTTYWV